MSFLDVFTKLRNKRKKTLIYCYCKTIMGVDIMRQETIEERTVSIARYIIDTECTVRDAAKKFGISKSTVHTVRSICVG